MSDNIGKQIIKDMQEWSAEKEKKVDKAMSEIQKEMKAKLEAHKSEREKDQGAHPNRNYKTAPGTMRQNWGNATLNKMVKDAKIKAVRNKVLPSVVHLVNFNHMIKAHGRIVGEYKGTNFVTDVQEWGNKELDKKIKEIYGR